MADGDAVRVELSSGEAFYVAADLERVSAVLKGVGLRRVGGRMVNGAQVCQLVVDRVPSTVTPECLED